MKYLNSLRFGLAAVCFLFAGISQAEIFKVDIFAKDFNYAAFNGSATPPQDPVSGYIMFEANTFGASINAITDVSLLIDGHSYQANEIAGQPIGDGYLFGGLLSGINVITWGTNDFWVHAFTTVGGSFHYSSTSGNDAWTTSNYSYAYSKVAEPGSFALLLAGLLMVGLRTRKVRK